MTDESNPVEFVGSKPDERLLTEDSDKLPDAVGRPETIMPSRARGRIVGTGATLTAVSLVLGVLLVLLGRRSTPCPAASTRLSIAILVVGAILVIHPLGLGRTSPSSPPTRSRAEATPR